MKNSNKITLKTLSPVRILSSQWCFKWMIQLPREGCNVSVCLCCNSKKMRWTAQGIAEPKL